LRQDLEAPTLLVGPRKPSPKEAIDAAVMRRAIRSECRLQMIYTDVKGCSSRRVVVWPFAMGYFEEARVLVAWRETRKDFRHFRTDRSKSRSKGQRYPHRLNVLLREWRSAVGAN
jgi:predicted DNA-binding transcriptional regulator YafY